jgi:hypothetical protein
MQPIICELKFFSDCTFAREHPENEKFSLLQIGQRTVATSPHIFQYSRTFARSRKAISQ